MKFIIFFFVMLFGVPLMGIKASTSDAFRGWVLTFVIATTAFANQIKINFVSTESYRGPERGFELNLTDLCAWALVIALVSRHKKAIKWFPYNSIPLAGLFIVAIISTLDAPERLYAAFALFKLVRAYVIYWAVANTLRTNVPRESIWRGFLILGMYVDFLCLKEKYVSHIYRVPGPFDHSNTVPLFLNLVMPALLIWGLCDKNMPKRNSVLSIITSLLMVFSVLITYSRAGLALSVGATVFAILVANIRARSAKVTLVSIGVFIALCIGGALTMKSIQDRVKDAPESSEEARIEFNIAAKKMLLDHPLGVGINNFSAVLTKEGRYNGHITVMADEEQSGVCHHIYLLTCAELGYGGIAVFLLIILRWAWHALFYAFKSKEIEGLVLFGLLLGFLTLHISGLLEWVLRITPVTFLFVICGALATGLCDRIDFQIRAKKRAKAASRSMSMPKAVTHIPLSSRRIGFNE